MCAEEGQANASLPRAVAVEEELPHCHQKEDQHGGHHCPSKVGVCHPLAALREAQEYEHGDPIVDCRQEDGWIDSPALDEENVERKGGPQEY